MDFLNSNEESLLMAYTNFLYFIKVLEFGFLLNPSNNSDTNYNSFSNAELNSLDQIFVQNFSRYVINKLCQCLSINSKSNVALTQCPCSVTIDSLSNDSAEILIENKSCCTSNNEPVRMSATKIANTSGGYVSHANMEVYNSIQKMDMDQIMQANKFKIAASQINPQVVDVIKSGTLKEWPPAPVNVADSASPTEKMSLLLLRFLFELIRRFSIRIVVEDFWQTEAAICRKELEQDGKKPAPPPALKHSITCADIIEFGIIKNVKDETIKSWEMACYFLLCNLVNNTNDDKFNDNLSKIREQIGNAASTKM